MNKNIRKIASKIDDVRMVGGHETTEFVEVVIDELRKMAKKMPPETIPHIKYFLDSIDRA